MVLFPCVWLNLSHCFYDLSLVLFFFFWIKYRHVREYIVITCECIVKWNNNNCTFNFLSTVYNGNWCTCSLAGFLRLRVFNTWFPEWEKIPLIFYEMNFGADYKFAMHHTNTQANLTHQHQMKHELLLCAFGVSDKRFIARACN